MNDNNELWRWECNNVNSSRHCYAHYPYQQAVEKHALSVFGRQHQQTQSGKEISGLYLSMAPRSYGDCLFRCWSSDSLPDRVGHVRNSVQDFTNGVLKEQTLDCNNPSNSMIYRVDFFWTLLLNHSFLLNEPQRYDNSHKQASKSATVTCCCRRNMESQNTGFIQNGRWNMCFGEYDPHLLTTAYIMIIV